jgi:hypothetical protein
MPDATGETVSHKTNAIYIPESRQPETAVTSLSTGWTEALDPTSSRTYYSQFTTGDFLGASI